MNTPVRIDNQLPCGTVITFERDTAENIAAQYPSNSEYAIYLRTGRLPPGFHKMKRPRMEKEVNIAPKSISHREVEEIEIVKKRSSFARLIGWLNSKLNP